MILGLAVFNISRPDNRVEYDMWYSSSNDEALDFIQDFGQIDDKFGDQVLMTPHFRIDFYIDDNEPYVEEHCFAAGKYCPDTSAYMGNDLS